MTRAVLPRPFVQIFGDVVDALSAASLEYLQTVDPTITGVHYQYGHLPDVQNDLISKGNSPVMEVKFGKYPFIWLVQDFPETRGNSNWEELTLRIIIATVTKQEYSADQRYANTFLPILYPLYDNLLEAMSVYRGFHIQSAGQIQHTKWDRLQWGRDSGGNSNDANKLPDYIDAIELTNLKVKVKSQQCA